MPSGALSPLDPTLTASITTLLALIAHCRSSLSSAVLFAPSTASLDSPLSILYDTATLVKAHTTRLSIALRPPISPDVASKFLSELSSTVVPALTAAATSLQPGIHGEILCKETTRSVDSLLRELGEFISRATTSTDDEQGRGRLVDTGVVWNAADKVAALKTGGAAGAVDRVLSECAEIMKDAESELKDWLQEAAEATDGNVDNDAEKDEEGEFSGDEGDDAFWDSATKGHNLKPEVKERVERTLKRFKLVGILFSAARKRRLANDAEGKLGTDVKRLDLLAKTSKELEGFADELSMAYMEGEDEDAKRLHHDFETTAINLAELLAKNDKGDEDKFTPWFHNCRKALLDSA